MTAAIFPTKRSNRDKRLVATPSVTGWLIGGSANPLRYSSTRVLTEV